MQEQTQEQKKIPMWQKICYGSAQGGGNIISSLVGSYLLSYYTDSALIGAAAIATMFVVCRVFDGVTDLIFGGLIDRTNTKIGKARPWLIASGPLSFIALVLILSVPSGFSENMKLFYAYLTYIFLNCIVVTIHALAHSALLARMTRDSSDRDTTAVVGSFINALVGTLASSVIAILVQSVGWQMTGVILGIVSCAMILVTGFVNKEVVGMESTDSASAGASIPMKEQFKATVKNRYFFLCLAIGALVLFVNANSLSAIVYYCNYVLADPDFTSTVMLFGNLPGIFILFVLPWFFRKFSKQKALLLGSAISIVGYVIMGLFGMNRILLIVGFMLRMVGLSPVFACVYPLIADCCDYCEWKTGVRSEGLTSASYSVGSKIGIGFGSAFTAAMLALTGYDGSAAVQSAAAISGIKFITSWANIIFLVLLFVCAIFMNVEKYLPEIRKSRKAAS